MSIRGFSSISAAKYSLINHRCRLVALHHLRVDSTFLTFLRMASNNSNVTDLPPFDPKPSFRLTQSPNPSWKLGDGLNKNEIGERWKEDEKLGRKAFDVEKMAKPEIYRLITSAVEPRPVAFISTLSKDNVPNLAPFSYFSLVSHNPLIVSVSFSLRPQKPKDTRENIREMKEFVVDLISEPFVEAANACSVEAPHDIDEWVLSNLTPEPSAKVKPPRTKESAVSLECELYHMQDITALDSDQITNTLVLGLVKMIHVRNAVLNAEGNAVDIVRLAAVSRLGGNVYARIGEGFDVSRPSWRAIKDEAEELMSRKGRN